VHEAVATAEQGAGGKPSGTVVEVYQAGYRLRDSVIRPARVVVAA
jgi:molecular chaperone GrpE (heat shock protein)